MTMRLALIFVATALTAAGAVAQDQANPTPPPELKALAESCNARKFETTVEAMVNGTKRTRKVKLCGKERQTDAEWAATLKDAAAKTRAGEGMSPAMKEAIIAAINGEISRIEAAGAAITLPAAVTPPAARPPEYSVLPPIPPAPPVATRTASSTPAAAPARPRLTIRCAERGDRGEGDPCSFLERETVLTIRADEDLADGATLRFLRRGDVRGELTVARLRKGQMIRARLPAPLCAGVMNSKAEIQILGRGAGATAETRVVDTLGPFGLRC